MAKTVSDESNENISKMKKLYNNCTLKNIVLFFTTILFITTIFDLISFGILTYTSNIETVLNSDSNITISFNIINFISFLLLLIGICRNNIPLMKQFIYIYCFYIAYEVIYFALDDIDQDDSYSKKDTIKQLTIIFFNFFYYIIVYTYIDNAIKGIYEENSIRDLEEGEKS